VRFLQGNRIGPQQIAIVSRLPVLSAFGEAFTSAGGSRAPPRGFAYAALKLPDGRLLQLYSVHLKANGGDSEANIRTREESARQIISHVARMQEIHGETPVLVGGDFNLLLDQPGMAHERTLKLFLEAGFRWGWEGVPLEKRVSWPARGSFGDACLDHVVTRGMPAGTSRVLTSWDDVSDHRPVEHPVKLR
jgi:endonuclease/exonuclease/phosphatase family metal-dependent hydrolase